MRIGCLHAVRWMSQHAVGSLAGRLTHAVSQMLEARHASNFTEDQRAPNIAFKKTRAITPHGAHAATCIQCCTSEDADVADGAGHT